VTGLSQATGIPEAWLLSGYFVTDPNDTITEGQYMVEFLKDTFTGKQEKLSRQFVVIKAGQIDGKFRILADLEAPYYHEANLTEVPEEKSTVFRPLGGMRLHLEAKIAEEIANHVVAYRWSTSDNKGAFYLTAAELAEMEDAGIPDAIVTRLEHVKDKSFDDETTFVKQVQEMIGGYIITDQALSSMKAVGVPTTVCTRLKNERNELINRLYQEEETFVEKVGASIAGWRLTSEALENMVSDDLDIKLSESLYQKLKKKLSELEVSYSQDQGITAETYLGIVAAAIELTV